MNTYKTTNISLASYLLALWTNEDVKGVSLSRIDRENTINTFVFNDPNGRAPLMAEHYKRNGRIRVIDFVQARQHLNKMLRELKTPEVDPSKPLTPEFWRAQ